MNIENITHPDLVSRLVKPGADIADQITGPEADLWHAATGVATEAGEIAEAFVIEEADGELDRENLIEELGDIEFYLEQTRQNLGIDPEEIEDVSLNFRLGFTGLSVSAILCVGATNLLDLAKKVAIYQKQVERQSFLEALARIDVSLDNIRRLTDISREETLEGNIAKLSKRYASGSYSNAQAQARADKEEGQ